MARIWDVVTGQPNGAPLQHARRVLAVRFAANGRDLFTATDEDCSRWELPPDERPVGDLTLLANVLSGRRVVHATTLAPVPSEELQQIWRRLCGKYSGDPQGDATRVSLIRSTRKRSEEAEAFLGLLPYGYRRRVGSNLDC